MEDSQTLSQKMFFPSSLSCQPSSVKVLADRGTKPFTNDQICDLIAAKVAEFRLSREYALFTNRTPAQTDFLLQPESSTSPSTFIVSLPKTSTSGNDDEHKRSSNPTAFQLHSFTVGQGPEEDSLRTAKSGSEATPKSNKKEDSQILSDVASTCEKDDQSPVVLTAISKNGDKLLKEFSLTLSDGSPEKDNKTLDYKGGQTELCCGLECFQQKKGDVAKEEEKVVGGEGMATTSRSNTIKDQRSKGHQDSHLTLKNQSVHFMPTSSANETDRVVSPGSHQQNSSKKFKQTKHNYTAQSNTDGTPSYPILIDPQYDNISDAEEPLGLTTRFQKLEQYENISEDENHFSRKRAGKMGFTSPVLSEANSKTVENVQSETLIQSGFHGELIPNKKAAPKADTFDETEIHSCQCSVEAADDSEHHLCPKCSEGDLGGQTNHLYNPCSVLNDEVDKQCDEEEEESENDDWEVIPVSILDLKFEPASEDVVQDACEYGQKVHQGCRSARQSFALKPVPASAFSRMAVFDTPDDQEQAIKFGQLSFIMPSCGSPKRKPQMVRKELDSESEDSCDTDNSSTYSSGPECNYMTVPKELFKSFSIPAPRATYHCVPEKKDAQTPPGLETVQNKISPDDGIISLLDSDEECDTHFETKRKNRLSQTSENLDLPGYKQQMASLESMDSESEECVLVEDEVSKQNYENVVIILSDSDDEGRENYNQAKNIVTADFVDCGRAGSVRQSRNTATLEEPPPVLEPGLGDLSKLQHMSKPEHRKQKSSRPRVSSQQSDSTLREDLTKQREVSSEAGNSDVFPNDAANALVPKRKIWKMAPSKPRLSLEADSTVSSTVIPRMFLRECKSNERITLVSESRHPRQDPSETMSMAKSSTVTSTNILLKEKLQLLMRDRSVSIPKANETHRKSSRRMMHVSPSQYQRSHSSDSPSTLDHPSTPTRLSSALAPVQSMQGTSHARNKVFSDWQRQHVPRRTENKKK